MPTKEQFIRDFMSNFAMDECNTKILQARIAQAFGNTSVLNAREKEIIEHGYINYFTTHFGMDESNTRTLQARFAELFGTKPNPQEQLAIESSYIKYFTSKFTMDASNTQILDTRFMQLFGHKIENHFAAEILSTHYHKWFEQHFAMDDTNHTILRECENSVISGVSAGDVSGICPTVKDQLKSCLGGTLST